MPTVNTRRPSEATYEVAVPNRDKRFRELIVYVADKCGMDPSFGATKLNKILWYADFVSYKQRGKPITGERYQRLQNGPCPVRLKPVRESMVGKDVVVRIVPVGTYQQHRIVALRSADLSVFDAEDIAFVDRIIEILRDLNATEISELSHGMAWKTRFDGDPIPYQAAFLSDEAVTASDIARTEDLAGALGWNAYRSAA